MPLPPVLFSIPRLLARSRLGRRCGGGFAVGSRVEAGMPFETAAAHPRPRRIRLRLRRVRLAGIALRLRRTPAHRNQSRDQNPSFQHPSLRSPPHSLYCRSYGKDGNSGPSFSVGDDCSTLKTSFSAGAEVVATGSTSSKPGSLPGLPPHAYPRKWKKRRSNDKKPERSAHCSNPKFLNHGAPVGGPG